MTHVVRSLAQSGLFVSAMFGLLSVGITSVATAKNSSNLTYEYPESVVEAYLTACGSDGTETLSRATMRDICSCTIDAFQQKYSLMEFREIGQAISEGDEVPTEMRQITSDCVKHVMFRADV